MRRPCKYSSDEERLKMNNEYHNKYEKKLWKCDSYNIEMKYGSKIKHLLSKMHLKNEFKPWKCDVCNIESHFNSKANHLQIRKHKKKECSTCSESE